MIHVVPKSKHFYALMKTDQGENDLWSPSFSFIFPVKVLGKKQPATLDNKQNQFSWGFMIFKSEHSLSVK